MKKILAIIPLVALLIYLSSDYQVSAAALDYNNVIYYCYKVTGNYTNPHNGGTLQNKYITYILASNSVINISSSRQFTSPGSTLYTYSSAIMFGTDFPVFTTEGLYVTNFTARINQEDYAIIGIQGSFVNNSNIMSFDNYDDYNDYINPPVPEATWWDHVQDYLGSWLGEYTLFDLIDDLWLDWFGLQLDGDDVFYGNDVELIYAPSPTPFPTQIPYQTLIIPDGNGGQQIIYKYPDPSGNPITATAPPPEPTYTIRITDSPVIELSGVPIPPDEGMQDVIDAIDDNLEEYQPGFEAIGNSMSVLPVKWFFFFGIPAAIIIIAGVIKSLLG